MNNQVDTKKYTTMRIERELKDKLELLGNKSRRSATQELHVAVVSWIEDNAAIHREEQSHG